MIFEDSLMKLIENVRGKTDKYVSMWKVCPEQIIDWSNLFICKGRNLMPTGFVFKNDFDTFLFLFWKFFSVHLAGLYILGNGSPCNRPLNIAQDNQQHKL